MVAGCRLIQRQAMCCVCCSGCRKDSFHPYSHPTRRSLLLMRIPGTARWVISTGNHLQCASARRCLYLTSSCLCANTSALRLSCWRIDAANGEWSESTIQASEEFASPTWIGVPRTLDTLWCLCTCFDKWHSHWRTHGISHKANQEGTRPFWPHRQ